MIKRKINGFEPKEKFMKEGKKIEKIKSKEEISIDKEKDELSKEIVHWFASRKFDEDFGVGLVDEEDEEYVGEKLFGNIKEEKFKYISIISLIYGIEDEKKIEGINKNLVEIDKLTAAKIEAKYDRQEEGLSPDEIILQGPKIYVESLEEQKEACKKRMELKKELKSILSDSLKGKRVFELGGRELKQILSEQGADAVSYDAEGFDWSKWGKSVETTTIDKAMTLDNYKDILDKIDPEDKKHEFDLTVSRQLFDSGSGIEQTKQAYEGDYDKNAKEVLSVLSKITKPGGYSIHQIGFSDGSLFGNKKTEDKVLEELGFEKVGIYGGHTLREMDSERKDYCPPGLEDPIVILKKNKPR